MPPTIDEITITVHTPITTLITVKKERSFWARKVRMAMLRFSRTSLRNSLIDGNSLINEYSLAETFWS